MDSSKESSDKNQSQETLRDTVRGLQHLLALLELTEERLGLECRSIAIQKEVVQRLIMELDDSSWFDRQANKNIYCGPPMDASQEESNYQTDNL
jgi:hypothetical protein